MKRKDNPAHLMMLCLATLLLIWGAAALSGCTRTVYTPVESVSMRSDTVRVLTQRVDSVVMRDSVAVYINGDTVRITQYRDRYRDRLRVDTLYRSVTDTLRVSVPYPIERQLSKWEQTKMDFGGMAIGALVIAVCAAVVWLVRSFRK